MELMEALAQPNVSARRRFDRTKGVLLGSECGGCGLRSWPGRSVCSRCGSADLAEVELAGEAILISSTRVWVARPGLDVPYMLAQVWLAGGVRVFGHLRGRSEVRAGSALRVAFATNSAEEPQFWFEPA
jgi:uncharacterized OB-fold protein